MDLTPAADWEPPGHWRRVTVIESHTGGEPFRVVVSGLPAIEGNTMLERRAFAMEHHDTLRRALMWEPRGHADMYGGWVGPPVTPDSNLSVLFIHNEGFSTMCGHGIIALAKVVIETGMVRLDPSSPRLRIDTPAGHVDVTVMLRNGKVERVSFVNVPSFAAALGAVAVVPGLGEVSYDLAFGGAFYAYVDGPGLGLDMGDQNALVVAGRAIKTAIQGTVEIEHPEHPDLGFLYGVIFTGPAALTRSHSRHVCVFADGEVDRSPTGTGVSGRLAILHSLNEIAVGDSIEVESIVGSVFGGRLAGKTTVGPHTAVIPEISGVAHILGRSEFWIDPEDEIGAGFLVR